MKNAITEFRVNACISYGSNEFYFYGIGRILI